MPRFLKWLTILLLCVLALAALWLWAAWSWSYSTGERAGWVQKLSRKGWVCKTWEGELALVSVPGSAVEKFFFTVRDDEVAQQIMKAMGKRVSLHYEEKVGLPGSCFGDTRHYVVRLDMATEIPLATGVAVPTGAPTLPAAPAETTGATGAAPGAGEGASR